MVGFPLAAAALVSPIAAQDVDPKILEVLNMLFDAGDAKQALKLLKAGVLESLEENPKSLSKVCLSAAMHAGGMAKQKADAPALTDLLLKSAETTAAAHADKADSHWALGHACLASARVARALGAKELKADPWVRAAESFEKAYATEPRNGTALAEAADALAEAAEIPGADAADLHGKASALSAQALEKHPGEPAVLKSAALLGLSRARGLLAARDKSGAEAALEEGIAILAPHLKGADSDVDLATAHNEIVSFVKGNPRELKKPKAEFLMASPRLPIQLTVELPVSRYWAMSKDGNRIRQFTSSYQLLRSIAFNNFAWDTNWRLADGTLVDGGNLKGLSTNEYDISLREFKKLKSKRAAGKQKLNPRLDEGWYYEAGGIDHEGDYVLQRSWFFKSKAGHQTSFRVTIYDYIEGQPLDAAAEALLDSIREVVRK